MAESIEKRLEKRAAALGEQLTNRDKREAVKFFDTPYEELDGLDQMVLLAHVADRARSIEDYDRMPLAELQKVILGE